MEADYVQIRLLLLNLSFHAQTTLSYSIIRILFAITIEFAW